jgi:hypothetical protein
MAGILGLCPQCSGKETKGRKSPEEPRDGLGSRTGLKQCLIQEVLGCSQQQDGKGIWRHPK